MNRYYIFFLIMYFLSCSPNGHEEPQIHALRASLTIAETELDENTDAALPFSDFLKEMSRDQMIAAGDEALHELAQLYFPDSTVIKGFDLHAREIGTLGNFKLVFYEYFDLYSSEQYHIT